MAENKNDLDYQNEAYHEIEENKSVFQAFKDFFNRQKALPESSESKHKSTNIDMKTMMSFREFRASLVERVGNFFSALSNIGAPKKEEITNTLKPEIVSSQTKEATSEKTRNDDESVVSQETRYFSGNISVNQQQKMPSAETIIIAETTQEKEVETDSIDKGTIAVDENFEKNTDRMESASITVADQPNLNKTQNQQPKNIIIPKESGKTIKEKNDDQHTR